MAATKEALFLALDVSPSMAQHLPGVLSALQGQLCDKLLHSKQDAFGMLLVGSAETHNTCSEEMGGYEHLRVAGSMGSVGMKRVLEVGEIRTEVGGRADAVDAVVVAADALARYVRKNKWAKRIVLLTDGASLSADCDDDELGDIASQLASNDIRLDVVMLHPLSALSVGAASAGGDDQAAEGAALAVWAALSALGNRLNALGEERGRTLFGAEHWNETARRWAAPVVKRVRPTAVYRGPLALGPGGFVPVRVWAKVSRSGTLPLKFGSVSKAALAAEAAEAEAAGAGGSAAADGGGAEAREAKEASVATETRYVRKGDPDHDVPPERRVNAYRYGRDLIPLSGAQEEALKQGARTSGRAKRQHANHQTPTTKEVLKTEPPTVGRQGPHAKHHTPSTTR